MALSSRWERSRASAITYSPLTGRIADIRLMSEGGLLASSTDYGVVSTSNPLTGKVFRGFFDAAGTRNGLGIGNPNAEFSPNVYLCRIFAERSTAKILWGFTHGEVAVTTANKVADPSRSTAARFSRSLISEQHNGGVVDAVWGEGGDLFVTAGTDGKVKLWDAAKMRCFWTSPALQDDPFPASSPSHLNFDSRKGIVVAAFSDGDLRVWWGFLPSYVAGDVPQINEVIIPPRSLPPLPFAGMSHLVLDTADGTSLLVHRLDSAYFYRHNVNLATGEVETVEFGDETTGSIRSLRLTTTAQAKALPFVLAGDSQGLLNVYNWNALHAPNEGSVQPVRRISAFDDGDAVSSIAWNPWVLATGSSTGTVKIWDSLKFCLLRTFQPPTRGHTGDASIVLEREMIVIALGDKITTWKAGPVRKSNKMVHPSKKGKNNTLAKWRRELYDLIALSNGFLWVYCRTSGYVPRYL
jgi:WD40 repeat protein